MYSGKQALRLEKFKASDNYAALLREVVMGEETYQQGIAVYSTALMKWESIDGEEVAAMVGWLKK